jgi:two-component system chemotaxis response regulator CheY
MQHCLVIDDSSIIRKYTRLIFEALRFRVSEAETRDEALMRLELESPDLILVDWQLPGASSHELIAKIRAMHLQVSPFIIYLTTENDAVDINKALSAGADDYLLKPFNREIIEMKLHDIRVAA